ncbi:GNAT family acetyltransferase [Acidihalobacter aeolianus]|uniref:GNAT family acetyltransferase n=1 Tax=Acidihalobacter aeolianus TaxID=2792603 RepID=A0A1D8K6Z5_9GAMM|nr:GNAT family acetyltransferase [Acidihalobacter aeolianus]AOV16690.1 GNAT family acetyltransferase [Acidihalobacter aeolianus]
MITVRPYLASDEDAVVALWDTCGLTRPWNDPRRDIARKQAEHPELFLVGERDGALIATAMAGYDGHRGWLNYLAVHPDHRRQGYGRVLVESIEHRLTAIGYPKLNLQVRSDNAEAVEFYRSLDYATDAVISLGRRLIADT